MPGKNFMWSCQIEGPVRLVVFVLRGSETSTNCCKCSKTKQVFKLYLLIRIWSQTNASVVSCSKRAALEGSRRRIHTLRALCTMDWFVNDGEDQISDCPCDRKIMHWTQFGAQVDPRLGFAAFLPCPAGLEAVHFEPVCQTSVSH